MLGSNLEVAPQAYPDPDYKLNRSSMSESVLSARDADPSLSYSARCPTTPVMLNWRELRCQLPALRSAAHLFVCITVVTVRQEVSWAGGDGGRSRSRSERGKKAREGDGPPITLLIGWNAETKKRRFPVSSRYFKPEPDQFGGSRSYCVAPPPLSMYLSIYLSIYPSVRRTFMYFSRARMSWLRTAALRVNPKLSASGGGALLAITRVELANNELRELPRELFSLVSLR